MRPKLVIVGGDGLEVEAEFEGLDRSIAALANQGIRTVVIGPMVTHRLRVPNILASRALEGVRDVLSAGDTVSNTAIMSSNAKAYFGNDARITFVSPRSDICSDRGCVLMDGSDVLYYDEDHFTLEGSAFYAKRLLDIIDARLGRLQ